MLRKKEERGMDLSLKNAEYKAKIAHDLTCNVQEVQQRVNQVEYHGNLERAHQGFSRLAKSQKLKNDLEKARIERLKATRDEKQ